MDSIEYALAMGKKIQQSFEDGEELPWHERVAKASAEIEAEEDPS